MQAGQTDAGIGFIHRTIALNPQVIFEPAFAGTQPGCAIVTRLGVNLVLYDHVRAPGDVFDWTLPLLLRTGTIVHAESRKELPGLCSSNGLN